MNSFFFFLSPEYLETIAIITLILVSIVLLLYILLFIIGMIYAIKIIKNITAISTSLKETSELVNSYAWKPLEVAYHVFEYFKKK